MVANPTEKPLPKTKSAKPVSDAVGLSAKGARVASPGVALDEIGGDDF